MHVALQAISRLTVVLLTAGSGLWGSGILAASPNTTISFTTSQVSAGEKVYEQNCAACHGRNLEGASAGPLAGAAFIAINKRRHATVGDIFEITRTQMPLNAPASLTPSQYVDILAFILKANGFKSGTKPLRLEAARASKVPLYR
ncbi:MAG: c-type cytochrome [Vulcanimicrobiaceae bacterium]